MNLSDTPSDVAKLGVPNSQTTHVKFANDTREVEQLHWGCFSVNFCSFVFPYYIRGEKQTNKNKMYAATNKKGTNYCLSVPFTNILELWLLLQNLLIVHDVDAFLNSA